jgi:GNAT superfamily N-acetyltransferase
MIEARALRRREDLDRYVAFSHDVYRGNPYWVPPDPHLSATLAGESAAGQHCRIQPFAVEVGGRFLATATAVVDDLFNQHWRDRIGHVVYFEALDGEDEAAGAVLAAATGWLKAQGCRAARVSFLYGWQLPLTIDAYDRVPTAFHTYNPPSYHRLIKDAGFVSECGLVEYRVQFTPELEKRYADYESAAASADVTLRRWDFDQPTPEAERFAASYNESFASHWGAPQFTVAEIEEFIAGLKEADAADLTVFAEHRGDIVGSVLAVPDFNQVARHTPGSQAPAIDHGILLSISVTPSFRGRGINLAMAARSYRVMMTRGYTSASYTTVLDTNRPSRRTAEKLGAHVARNFVVYQRAMEY